jgi:F-type H+-transporting ATPase subunit epsilon
MSLTLVVVTPEQTALETEADFVALPLFDGELGVAPGRAPLIGRLGFGQLRVKHGGTESRYYIDGGFAQVADDVVTVLTPRAIPAGQIDVNSAEKQLEAVRLRPTNTPELLEIRDRLEAQARGMLFVAKHAS